MKLVILSAGHVAGSVARILATTGSYSELVIADLDLEKATAVADEVGATAVQFDAHDTASIAAIITGADVVFNAVGPFYRLGLLILRTAVECGVNYVDVCDEFDTAAALSGADLVGRQRLGSRCALPRPPFLPRRCSRRAHSPSLARRLNLAGPTRVRGTRVREAGVSTSRS